MKKLKVIPETWSDQEASDTFSTAIIVIRTHRMTPPVTQFSSLEQSLLQGSLLDAVVNHERTKAQVRDDASRE